MRKIPIQLNNVKYRDDKSEKFILNKVKEKLDEIIIIKKNKFKVMNKIPGKNIDLTGDKVKMNFKCRQPSGHVLKCDFEFFRLWFIYIA